MAKSFLSVMGLYAYDQTLFDNLNVPTGIDKQDVIDDIILHCAELEVIYPRHDTMKYAVGVWSRKNALVWKKLYDSTQFDYNPIWNKDGTVTETETRNLRNTSTGSNSSETSGSSSNDNEHKVAAFNSSDYENREKISTEIEDSASSEGSFSNSGTDTGTVTMSRTEQGNIGITTTQQMIREERDVVKFNLIDFITESFLTEFCIQVY